MTAAAEIPEPAEDDPALSALAAQAVTLYLGGLPHHQIAEALHTDQDVATLIETELERRNPNTPGSIALELERVTALWRSAYAKAVGGDNVAQRMAMSLSQYRMRLLNQADRSRRNSTVSPGGPTDIQQAWTILAGGAPAAATALLDVATNGRSELARVTASTAILDRVGLVGKPEVQIAVVPADVLEASRSEITDSLADVVRNRLKALAPAAIAPFEEEEYGYTLPTDEIVDAVVVVVDAEPDSM
jgi:hypothetical protein